MAGAASPKFSFLPGSFLLPPLLIHSLRAHTTTVPFKSFPVYIFIRNLNHWLAGQLFHISYFLSLQAAIDKWMEETLATASQDLPAEAAERISWEVISSEREGNSPPHQSFEEALFSWSQVLPRV